MIFQRQQEINGQILQLSKDIVKKYQNGDVEMAQISVLLSPFGY